MIPFNKLSLAGDEFLNIESAIKGLYTAGNGPFCKRCEEMIGRALGAHRVLLTTSCTHALEMAALLLEINSGDEVIVPSFTFVSTVNAFVLRGARPVFVDIRPDTLNMDERQLESLISNRTKAIIPVHYAGVGCEMDPILVVAKRRGIVVVEDNAHGLFGRYKGQPLGSFGSLATQSFHETKNVTCGEGGALVINDPRFVERAEIIREKGTNRNRFLRGQVDKYTWVDIGSSYVISDMLGGFLCAQLEKALVIQARRKVIWDRYAKELAAWASQSGVRLPIVPAECEQAYHMFYLLMPDGESRSKFIAHLWEHGAQSVFHYVPLHLSPMGLRFGGRQGDCPITENLSARLVRLPFFTGMTVEEQATVIEAVVTFTK
jgi:dTDP-4-amino-4,6-dideoxygalactose transaminase